MSFQRMLYLPKVFEQGRAAALLGTHMSETPAPMGFTFCPFPLGSTERHNFLGGCVEAYMKDDCMIQGEQ